jgi:hypothetical protein
MLAILLHICEVILTEVLHGFPQSFQAKTGKDIEITLRIPLFLLLH